MPDFKLPLSGDVVQALNPWTHLFHSERSVSLGKSACPDVERRVIEEVGSYGRQLGRIGDALEVLLNHLEVDGLKADEIGVLEELRLQLALVRRVKQRES